MDLTGLGEGEELGSGACGVVKLMEDEDGERYAVKLLTGSQYRTE
jgi:hypothetical protein